MSYGQNLPSGLVPIYNYNSADFNGQNMRARIESRYGFNIFRGDLVYADTDGYIHSLAELGTPGWKDQVIFGVFNGCSYAQPTAQNPTDFASPARPFWPAGTVVTNDPFGAVASIITDPAVIYTIQTNEAGAQWTSQNYTAAVGFDLSNPEVNGNFSSGQSSMFLDGDTIGESGFEQNGNLKIIGFDLNKKNNIPFPGGGSEPFVNVLVVIQNHYLITRAPGL